MSNVLITGCSSGFGELAALTFADHGHRVYATMRTPGKSAALNARADIHQFELDVTDSTSVNAKWSQDKGWEVNGGASSETSCKKNLDSESRAAMDCQIVHGPDIAWRSDANPRPTVQATIGGKTFRVKARSLNSYRMSFWGAARRITAEGAAKTTANSAKVNIAATCSTNHPNDPSVACVVNGGRQDGY